MFNSQLVAQTELTPTQGPRVVQYGPRSQSDQFALVNRCTGRQAGTQGVVGLFGANVQGIDEIATDLESPTDLEAQRANAGSA